MEITQFTYCPNGRQHRAGAGFLLSSPTAWSALPCTFQQISRSTTSTIWKWTQDLSYGRCGPSPGGRAVHLQFRGGRCGDAARSFRKIRSRIHPRRPKSLVLPAYEFCLKCSIYLQPAGRPRAISVTERDRLHRPIRNLARACAEAYLSQREAMGFPLLKNRELSPCARGPVRPSCFIRIGERREQANGSTFLFDRG